MILRSSKKNKSVTNQNVYEVIQEAKNKNAKIAKMIPLIENKQMVSNIKEINDTVTKIIQTVEKRPEVYKKMNNFFDYYLPVTANILNRYDEIENQRLTTEESKKFMESTEKMIAKINNAFKKQLANLYQPDMIDTDAEMKVFETMLQSDGFGQDKDFNI